MVKKHIQIQQFNIILIISITLCILIYTAYTFIRSQKVSAVSGTLDVSTSSVSNTGTLTGVKFADRDSVPYFLDPARSLTTSLNAVWHLEEAGSTRADSYGTNNLTDTSSVSSAAGKIGTAASFSGSNYLEIADNAALSVDDVDFTIAGWVYFNQVNDNSVLFGKWNTQDEYVVLYYNNRIRFYVKKVDNSASANVPADDLGVPSAATWYYVVAWHNKATSTINIQVNNGTVNTLSHDTGVRDSTNNFVIGSYGLGGGGNLNGRVDEVALWKRVLTANERTMLYNSGNGINLDASLTTSGNVGIGTTIPRNLLHVASTGTLTGKATLIVDQLESQDIFAASASGINKFVILNNGNVGIGSTTPATALDVNGTINASVFGFDVETKTAQCSGASCVATATCTAGYTYIVGFRATGSAACDTNPSACSAYCVNPGTASCNVTSTSNSVASVYIVCGKTN